jgi:hypothetical protein
MGSAKSIGVLRAIADVVGTTPDYSRYVQRLLADRNWRSHLIALTAAVLSREPGQHASHLWDTFDRGSWVAPQLAVALFWIDPEFVAESKRRIVALCPIVDDDGFFRGDTRDVSAKNLASMLGVMAHIPSEMRWVASELRMPDVQGLLKSDRDSAGAIVESWLDQATMRFRECGLASRFMGKS